MKKKISHQLPSDEVKTPSFSFLSLYKFFLPLTIGFICYGLFLLYTVGFSYGTDFRGGIEKQIFLGKSVAPGELKEALLKAGISAEVEQVISRDQVYIVRIAASDNAGNVAVERDFEDFIVDYAGSGYELEQTHLVSGVISGENKRNAIWTSLIVIGLIIAYLTLRFQLRFAVSAMVAVIHDVALMLGVALVAGMEINILTIVAVLTVFGYSVNDTIVLFDRVRELRAREVAPEVSGETLRMEQSLRMIFSRTVITSLTTLFVVFSLYMATSGEYKDFALLLIVGIFSGTYSSVYVAMPVAYTWQLVFPPKIKQPKKA